MRRLIEKVQAAFKHMRVEEFMNENVVLIHPERTLLHAKEMMRLKRISGIPVVDCDGKLVGIISLEDIIKALEGGYIKDRIGDHMTRDVVYLRKDETLKDAIDKFGKYGFGRFPVVDEFGKVVGIVTKNDILYGLLEKLASIYLHDERKQRVLESEVYPQLLERSLITGEHLNKAKADFVFRIDYSEISLIGVGAAKLKKFLEERGLEKDVIRRASIATYEAEANVVLHSESEGFIYCFIGGDSIVVRVEDFGRGIENVELAMKEGYSTAPDDIRELGFGAGMGLPNMKRFSDKMVIISEKGKGTIVEMSFFFVGDEGEGGTNS